MSLNGLDDAQVSDAYTASLAEAGGWFLLKYSSRDAVEVLARGSGGVSEARAAMDQYADKSPLYGFLLYRRRKVLLKYVPEGTSRLLQARVTVHFTEVTDKFSPHDSVFALAAADELTEHALAQASSLHTAAAPSSASSTSSRRKKLDGISEDAEEGPAQPSADSSAAGASTVKSEGGSPLAKGGSPSPEQDETASRAPPAESDAQLPPPAAEAAPRASIDGRPYTPASQPPAPSEVDAHSLRSPLGSDKHYATSVKSFSHLDHLYHDQAGGDPRASSQTARSGSADLYDFSYLYKPKVKLGPRPSDSRPHISSNGSANIAKVPASLKAAMRKATSSRPKSRDQRDQSAVPSIAFPPPPPVPTLSDVSTAHTRPNSSRGSTTSSVTKPPGITPEKQRLLKALELRKRQLKKAETKREEGPSAAEAPDATAGSQRETASTPAEAARENSSSGISETTLKHSSPKSDSSKVDSAVQLDTADHSGDEGRAPTPVASSPITASDPSSTRPTSISDDGDSRAPHKDETEALALSTSQPAEVENPVASDSSEDQDHAASLQTTVKVEDTPTASVYKTVTALPAVITPIRPKRRSWQKKSRGTTIPIRIDVASADNSDAEYLSDDSFMEELKSAKLEEAKPMSVSKSPIMPIFPRRRSSNSTQGERVSSTPLNMGFGDDAGRLSPGEAYAEKGRSFSAPGPPTQTKEEILAKKVNVSSGISQRIKALAQQSNKRESGATVGSIGPSSNRTSPDQVGSVVAQRAASFRSNYDPALSRPSSAVSRHTKRFSRSSISSIPALPTDMNMPPTAAGSPPPATPISPQHTGRSDIQTTFNGRRHDKPDSITVTARIIRQKPELAIPTDGPVELQPSPLTIDHVRANQSLSPPGVSPPSLSPTKTATPHSGTSSTIPGSPTKSTSASPRDSGSHAPRTSGESNSWRNIGRRRSEILMPPPTGFPRSQSITSLESAGEGPDKRDEKKGSRTSRLLKRMSNGFVGTSRKGLNHMGGPSTVQEEEDERKAVKQNGAAEGVEVGDLNVQFPDTLLWKRRFVEIDTSGNLVLSLSRSNEQSKGITKRYHLSEFKIPIAPDLERQEMPNSVILDFLDGRTLQCACEDMSGQIRVLEVLRGAWGVWSS